MRRVRCDLKDLPLTTTGQQTHCSNCKERGLKCVDEFAEVKAVKLLRRGRRLQQVEAVYGKTLDEDSDLYQPPALTPNLIPRLRPEFFSSPFYSRFHVQYPIIDPSEFCSRFFEFAKGNCNALDISGQLIAMILAVWATSFGVNEYGIEEVDNSPHAIRSRQERTNEMVREVLQLIDMHGVVRKPTWDGVRALLLLSPLTQEVQTPMERLVMHEATISQVFTLCSMASVSSVGTGQGKGVDLLVRSRIFWHAHVVEGITSGLRGGKLLLSDEDLNAFQKTVPPLGTTAVTRSEAYEFTYRYAQVPLQLASACRKVHAALTGPSARQNDEIDENLLHEAWGILDQSWKAFEGLKELGTLGIIRAEEVERYIYGWQIFIFECFNVIREALKQRVVVHSSRRKTPECSPIVRSPATTDAATRLLKVATTRCYTTVKRVVSIIRRFSGTAFFEYDASLVRDGVFFAGFMVAGESGTEDDVHVCLQALHQMRWAFSKNEERARTVRMAWEARKASSGRKAQLSPSVSSSDYDAYANALPSQDPRQLPPSSSLSTSSSRSSLRGEFSALNTGGAEDGSWTSPSSSSVSSGARSRQGSLQEDFMGPRSHRGSPVSTHAPTTPPFMSGPTPTQLQSGTFNPVSSSESSDNVAVHSLVPHRISPTLQYFPELEHFSFSPPSAPVGHTPVGSTSHQSQVAPFAFDNVPSLSPLSMRSHDSQPSQNSMGTPFSGLYDPRSSMLFAGSSHAAPLSTGDQQFGGSSSYYH